MSRNGGAVLKEDSLHFSISCILFTHCQYNVSNLICVWGMDSISISRTCRKKGKAVLDSSDTRRWWASQPVFQSLAALYGCIYWAIQMLQSIKCELRYNPWTWVLAFLLELAIWEIESKSEWMEQSKDSLLFSLSYYRCLWSPSEMCFAKLTHWIQYLFPTSVPLFVPAQVSGRYALKCSPSSNNCSR